MASLAAKLAIKQGAKQASKNSFRYQAKSMAKDMAIDAAMNSSYGSSAIERGSNVISSGFTVLSTIRWFVVTAIIASMLIFYFTAYGKLFSLIPGVKLDIPFKCYAGHVAGMYIADFLMSKLRRR